MPDRALESGRGEGSGYLTRPQKRPTAPHRSPRRATRPPSSPASPPRLLQGASRPTRGPRRRRGGRRPPARARARRASRAPSRPRLEVEADKGWPRERERASRPARPTLADAPLPVEGALAVPPPLGGQGRRRASGAAWSAAVRRGSGEARAFATHSSLSPAEQDSTPAAVSKRAATSAAALQQRGGDAVPVRIERPFEMLRPAPGGTLSTAQWRVPAVSTTKASPASACGKIHGSFD